ncbi:MAG: discoidin domain-containing protein [Planctomycetes bacterium]|nr:discoidin domain-containing protein [Planctomycetota bacterium]
MCRRTLFLIFLVLVLGGASYTWAGQEPVAHYKFEGTNDFSNTGTNAAAITGEPKGNAQIIWDDDRGSYVLSLPADGDYVYCERSWSGIVATEMTVMAWIKTRSVGSSDSIVALGYAWRLRSGSGGNVTFQVMNTSPVTAATGTLPVDDGTWHHVAGAYDGTEYKLYIDGRTNVSVASAGILKGAATAYYGTIGAHYKRSDGAPKFFFNGLIDDVRIYDRVLSEEEILEITAIAGVKAVTPSPTDGLQLDVVQDVVLSWMPGTSADKHDVYLGTNFDDVNEASPTIDPNNVYKGRQDPNQYAVGATLDFGKTYYWRIDEVEADGTTIHKGGLWQFTAEPFGYPIPASTVTATADSNDTGKGPENTTNGSGLDDALHSKETTDMWLSGSEPNAWIEYEFDKVYKLHEMRVWNYNGESILAGYGIRNATIEYSTDGIAYTTLGATHEFAQAPGADGYAHNTTIDFEGAVAKYVRITANSNWGGVLYDRYGLSEIGFYYIPIWAREPNPADGATGVGPNVVLGFRAGREAATHDVHLSTNREAVLDGTAYAGSVTEASYDAGPLDLGKTYYWRVDEVNEAQTPTTWQGDIWNFATPDYLIVDNFEDYNDYPPHEIWTTWVDGYGVPTNGALAGNADPPFAETTTVHGGEQSMPLFYENNFKYSEAERTLSPPQDWTKNGVKALLISFYGDPDNTVEQMYVKLNGSKVVYDGDPADIKQGSWNRWSIDLASFGVDLTNVTTLAIGFGDETNLTPGGSGVVYFDDIRLYRLVPEPPVEIWLEAEAADSITLPMQIYDSQLASGGQYIGTDEKSGDETEAPPVYGVATYNFTVPEGTYKVLFHVIVISGADSFWVRIPGAAYDPGTYRSTGWVKFNMIDKGDDWHWDEVHSNSHGNEVVKFTLSAGEHTLEIARRDDATLLDAILITDELDLDQRSLPHVIP